jgi:FkbM family methyltransferase
MTLEVSAMNAAKLIASFHALSAETRSHNDCVVIDGGFFRGKFSEAIIAELPSAKCIGFEPNHTLCQEWKAREPKSNNNLILENLALGHETSFRSFYTSNSFPATNSLLPRPPESGFQSPYYPKQAHLSQGQDVRVVALDEYCKEASIFKIFLLKLDLQGGELDALKGAKDLIGRAAIDIVYTEAVFIEKYDRQPLLHDLWNFLSSHGYRLHSLHDVYVGSYDPGESIFRDTQYNQCDALFISSNFAELLES